VVLFVLEIEALLADRTVFALWDRVQPRSHRANVEDAAQYAAATAKYLFDRVSSVVPHLRVLLGLIEGYVANESAL
jgi:hypothetical protein